MNQLDNQAASISVDALINYETVKSFGGEDWEAKRYQCSTCFSTVKSRQVKLSQVMSCPTLSCHVMSCQDRLSEIDRF